MVAACGLDLHYPLLDSLYGDNEELLGKWFKKTGKRDDIFLATKFGFVKGGQAYEVDSSAEYCKKACAESLRLLGIDVIDLCKSINDVLVFYVSFVATLVTDFETFRLVAQRQPKDTH